MIDGKYEYFAFISYRWGDEKMAKWLQEKLEHYKLPTSLREQNPDLPTHIRPIFRDKTDLNGHTLEESLMSALESSRYLIVICSPLATQSKWVNRGIQKFIDLGREKDIIPFIIDGEANADDPKNECFPPALRSLKGERAIYGININDNGRDAAAVKVVSRMFDVKYDTLWNRFLLEQKKRRWYTIAGLVAAILVVVGVAGYIWTQNQELDKRNVQIETQYKELQAKNAQIEQQNKDLDAKSDSIQAANDSIRQAYEKLDASEKYLSEANIALKEEKERLQSQIFKTEIARIPSIISERGVKDAYNNIADLYRNFSLSIEQRCILDNQLLVLANETKKKAYLHSGLFDKGGDVYRMSTSANDSLLAVVCWYSANINLIDMSNKKVQVLDNYDEIKLQPESAKFSRDSKYLWVKYGSSFSGSVLCLWDLNDKTYRIIHIKNKINNIWDFSPFGDGIIVRTSDRKPYFIDKNGNSYKIGNDDQECTAISNVNDTLYCVATNRALSIYDINKIDTPQLNYSLTFDRVKHLVAAGDRVAALYTNDTIVVYNAKCSYAETIEKKWNFGSYYDSSICFTKNGDKLYALDNTKLYDLNIYTGNMRVWDYVIDLGISTRHEHGKLATYGNKIILSDANELKIVALGSGYSPGEYGWLADVGYYHSAAQLGGCITQKDQLIFCNVGKWDFAKNNGEYIENVVVVSDFNYNKIVIVDGHNKQITGVGYSDVDKELYTCSLDSVLQIYNLRTHVKRKYKFDCALTTLLVKNNVCYLGDDKGNLHFFKNGIIIAPKKKLHNYAISAICVTNNDEYILSGNNSGGIVIFENKNNRQKNVKFSNSGVTSLEVDSNNNLYVGQKDGWVRVLDCNLVVIKNRKFGEQISSIKLNDIGQLAVCTTKTAYSDTQSADRCYIVSSDELLVLHELKATAPNALWWMSNTKLVGSNGVRYFAWQLPDKILIDIEKRLK